MFIIPLNTQADQQYEDMFENGNYRRRRRMKRPYRTGAHYSKMFQETYPTNPSNFGRAVFPTNHYQTYPRYDPNTPWMTSAPLGSYTACPSRQTFTYTAPPVSFRIYMHKKSCILIFKKK